MKFNISHLYDRMTINGYKLGAVSNSVDLLIGGGRTVLYGSNL